MIHISKLIFLTLIATTMFQCASKLPRVVKQKKFGGKPVDYSSIIYQDLKTEAELSLAQYFEKNPNLTHLMLMFGSASCKACTKKNKDVSANFVQKHPLWLDDAASRFELVGLTTDVGTSLKIFKQRWNSQELRKEWGYEFVRWHDSGGESVKKYFLDQGEEFRVPITVLLTREGIARKWNATDKTSLPEIFDLALRAVQGEVIAQPPSPPKPEGPVVPTKPEPEKPLPPPPPPVDPVAPIAGLDLWRVENPGRFSDMPALDCAGNKRDLGAIAKGTDLVIMSLVNGSCDVNCQNHLQELIKLDATCKAAIRFSSGRSRCKVVFGFDRAVGANWCGRADSFAESGVVYGAFKEHFDWQYLPKIDPTTFLPGPLPPYEKPMTFGFSNAGKLVLAKEGPQTADALWKQIDSPVVEKRPDGPNFQLLGDDATGAFAGEQNFKDILKDAEYTVIGTFDPSCGSCVHEMQCWSRGGTDHLYDYCRNSGGHCQIFALETIPPYNESMQEYYERLKSTVLQSEIRVPLVLDREIFGGEFTHFYDGYLTLKNPAWNGLPGTVIYDREGKIVASFEPRLPPTGSEESESLVCHEKDEVYESLRYLQWLVKSK